MTHSNMLIKIKKLKNAENEEKEYVSDTFQKKLIALIIRTNMAFNKVQKSYFVDLFTYLRVQKDILPSTYILKKKY